MIIIELIIKQAAPWKDVYIPRSIFTTSLYSVWVFRVMNRVIKNITGSYDQRQNVKTSIKDSS